VERTSRVRKTRAPYRRGIGIVLFDGRGRVFVGRRSDPKNAWQLPQGGIDPGESPLAAAWRELKEEIGTDKAEPIGQIEEWLTYDLPPRLAKRAWGGRFRGQKQKWFAFRFLGEDKDIDLGAHKREFADWKWAELDDLPNIIVAFKRALYRRLVAEFRFLSKPRSRRPVQRTRSPRSGASVRGKRL
jgi:putative (di)nucleoside polyphosphate hydrolase